MTANNREVSVKFECKSNTRIFDVGVKYCKRDL